MVTDERDDIPEDTTVTRGAVVVAVVVDMRHNKLQKWYKIKHNGHPMDVLTDTKSLIDVLTPPKPPTYGLCTCRYPLEHRHTGMDTDICGCWTLKRCPSIWGISKHMEGPLYPHHTCRYPLEQMHRGALETYRGVFEHTGASKHMGCV